MRRVGVALLLASILLIFPMINIVATSQEQENTEQLLGFDNVMKTEESGEDTAPSISLGEYHTCVILDDSMVSCWGRNPRGQLGDGTTTDRNTPVNISGWPSGRTAVAISAGLESTCVILDDGSIRCWGLNDHGQLGDGTTTDRYTPVNISGWPSGRTAVAISLGGHHSCAILDDGSVRCWGYNHAGQLGDGTTTDRYTPVNISGWPSGRTAVSISVGAIITCVILDDGSIRCWGYNRFGQLGDGTTTERYTPVSISGWPSGRTAVAISADYHTCAILDDGTLRCWGFNHVGQLGDGTTTDRYTPVNISGLPSGSTTVAISVTVDHTCAILNDGTVHCWGWNQYGQLGDGTTTDRHTPVSVSNWLNERTAVAISVELGNTCVILDDITVRCWGWLHSGQLDEDSDNDGWGDDYEVECLSNPNDSSSVPTDFDDDDICDELDPDDDNDGVADEIDAFPFDASESIDSDGDGVGNNADPCPTSPSGEILSSVEGCTLIEVYMPTLYLDDRECYLPINRHWDDFDVSNNFENYRDSRVDDDCSSYSSSSSPTPTVYYEVVEYSDHYVFEYWFYYADSRLEALRPLFQGLFPHEHDFEWAFVWVDKSEMEPYYFALSQHHWENEHFISSTDELWANVEWGGHGMVHHSESNPPSYAQGDGLVLRSGDFEFIQMNPTAADIGMGEFLRGDFCDYDQCKAPWLQPLFTYPDDYVYDSGDKGDYFYDMVGIIFAQLFSPAELYVQDSEGRITGLIDGQIREEIPLSWYDAERELVIILGNDGDYQFFVDGKANGTYGISLGSGNISEIRYFNGTDIPTNIGEIHQYSVNWGALGENGTSVNITVDFENDGIVDYEFWSDATLNQSEFTTAITPEPEPEPPIIEENLTCPDGFELSLEEECVTTDSTSVVNVGFGSISLTSVLAMSILAILAGVICVMFIIRRRKGSEPKVDDVQKQILGDEDASQKPTTSQSFGTIPFTPSPEAAGNISEDGYEWLESPIGSGVWYWRMSSDQDWAQWGDND